MGYARARRRADMRDLEVAVDVAAIAGSHDPHDELAVLDRIYDAVVPDPEPPPGVVPLERLDVKGRRIPGVHRFLELSEAVEDPQSVGARNLQHAPLGVQGESCDVPHGDQA